MHLKFIVDWGKMVGRHVLYIYGIGVKSGPHGAAASATC